MRGELNGLGLRVKTDEDRLDLKIKALEKHIKGHQPKLEELRGKFELIAKHIKKNQASVDQALLDLSKLY